MEDLLKDLIGKDYKDLKAKEFSDLVISRLSNGFYKKEVMVNNRGDGRRGRIDIVYYLNGKTIGIELDRLKPRNKSIFKLQQLEADERYIITRSPVTIIKI